MASTMTAESSSSGISKDAPQMQDDHDDTDALFEELEADEHFTELAGLREQRLEELKREIERAKEMKDHQHGRYMELTDEKDVIHTTAKEPRCIVHFYHRDFRRCKIMDRHLESLAPKYFATRFLKVLVENVPFLVEKLQIRTLPCVICFIGGVTKDRVVGFEELGNSDEFVTSVLELRLRQSGVISAAPLPLFKTPFGDSGFSGPTRSRIRGPTRRDDDDDDPYA